MFEDKCRDILDSLEAAHKAYYQSSTFTGPSLHFHLRSLESARIGDRELFSESAYAMLTSWGMHRMGKGGPKMLTFAEFDTSVQSVWPVAIELRNTEPHELTDDDWNNLKEIFRGIRCMATGASLVGNSKIMAHLLPNLVPPVDREYTLSFLFGNKMFSNNIENQWEKLSQILRDFFYPVVKDQAFQAKATEWMANRSFEWDTSHLKIADNLLIGLASIRKRQQVHKRE